MLKKNNRIKTKAIENFKLNSCNENQIIKSIIKHQASNYFIEPILDVGAGLGDIADSAFSDKTAYLIDVNDYSKHQKAEKHVRKKINFFDFIPPNGEKINTVLISHTLQCIDDDIDKLNTKIKSLNPLYINVVQNKNNDLLGEIIPWLEERNCNINPEVKIRNFPQRYELKTEFDFVGTVVCDDFEELAKEIVEVLLFAKLDGSLKTDFIQFLMKNLSRPELTINQALSIYVKK